jgi:hypothetical protein
MCCNKTGTTLRQSHPSTTTGRDILLLLILLLIALRKNDGTNNYVHASSSSSSSSSSLHNQRAWRSTVFRRKDTDRSRPTTFKVSGRRNLISDRKKGSMYYYTDRQQQERQILEQQVETALSASTTTSTGTNLGAMICQNSIATEEAAGRNWGAVCTCTSPNPTHTVLSCTDTLCSYCTEDGIQCDRFSYGVILDDEGTILRYYERDEYVLGRTETVLYSEDRITEGCSIHIDGIQCASCTYVQCEGGEYDIQVDCTNISDGESFNGCIDTDLQQLKRGGIFQIYKEDYKFCFTALDGCQHDVQTMGRINGGEYDCDCSTVEHRDGYDYDSTLLLCEGSCTPCNADASSCADTSIEQTYSGYVRDTTRITASYTTTPTSQVVTLVEQDCANAIGCKGCTFEVDGTVCSSCTVHQCDDGSMKQLVNCSNVDPTLSKVDLCVVPSSSSSSASIGTDTINRIDQTRFEYFSSTYQCQTSRSATACLETKSHIERHDGLDSYILKNKCSCEVGEDGATTLSCTSTCGDMCRGSICFRETFAQVFDPNGISVVMTRTTQYTHGLRETLVYTVYPDGDCQVEVDGTLCTSCSLQTCSVTTGFDDIRAGRLIDCSNVHSSAILDMCEDDFASHYEDQGFLTRVASSGFDSCEDRTATNSHCEAAELLELVNNNDVVTSIADNRLSSGSIRSGSTIMVDFDGITGCGPSKSVAPGLWYSILGTGSGIKASVCNERTDFPAQVSVYFSDSSSSCSNLSCLSALSTTTSDNNCTEAKWLGGIDETYYIRVHGHGSEDKGNFDLVLDWFPHVKNSCAVHGEEVESIEGRMYGCKCLEGADDTSDGTRSPGMYCEDDCIMCNADNSICGHGVTQWMFDEVTGEVLQEVEIFQYILGSRNNQKISLVRTLCSTRSSEEDECENSCTVSIDGEDCNDCQIVSCGGQDGPDGMMFSCSNIEETLVGNSCAAAVSNHSDAMYDGVATVLFQDTLTKCLPRNATTSCLHHKSVLEEVHGDDIECQCAENTSTGANRLMCADTGCLKCTDRHEMCGFASIEATIVPQASWETPHFTDSFFVLESQDGWDDQDSVMIDLAIAKLMALDVECVVIEDPSNTCQVAREEILLTSEFADSTACRCLETPNGGFDLACTIVESQCEYCDESESLCAELINFGQTISKYGHVVGHFHSFQYRAGRDDLLLVEQDAFGNSDHCTVSINGEVCTDCRKKPGCSRPHDFTYGIGGSVANQQIVNKPSMRDLLMELSIDCSNIPGDNHIAFECGHVPNAANEYEIDLLEVLSPYGALQVTCFEDEGRFNNTVFLPIT